MRAQAFQCHRCACRKPPQVKDGEVRSAGAHRQERGQWAIPLVLDVLDDGGAFFPALVSPALVFSAFVLSALVSSALVLPARFWRYLFGLWAFRFPWLFCL